MSESLKPRVIEMIREAFDEMNYVYTCDEDRARFVIGFNLDSSIDTTRINILVKEQFYIAYATVNLVANKNIEQVYEYICRVNNGLLNGNFEIDPLTGNVRYKIFVDYGDQLPSKKTVQNTVNISASTVEKYIDGLLSVITGAQSAEVAINEIEQPSDTEST